MSLFLLTPNIPNMQHLPLFLALRALTGSVFYRQNPLGHKGIISGVFLQVLMQL